MSSKRPVSILAVLAAIIGLVWGLPATATAAVQVEPTSVPDRIVLNPTATPHSSQSITWRTDTATTRALIEYAEAGESDIRRVTANTPGTRCCSSTGRTSDSRATDP